MVWQCLGVNRGHFRLCEVIKRFLKRFDPLGRFSPLAILDFGSQDVFVHTQNLYFAV